MFFAEFSVESELRKVRLPVKIIKLKEYSIEELVRRCDNYCKAHRLSGYTIHKGESLENSFVYRSYKEVEREQI